MPQKPASMHARASASGIAAVRPKTPEPAQYTSTRGSPSAPVAAAKASPTERRSVTSHGKAPGPEALRPKRETRQPPSSSCRATSAPIPDVAPTTRA